MMFADAATIRLKDNWGGKTLTATSKSDWSVVQTANRNNDWDSQKWVEEDLGNNVFRLKNKWSNDYLTATATDDGAIVNTAPLNKDWGSQKWKRTKVSDGVFRYQSQWGNKFLNTTGDFNYADVTTNTKNNSWGSMKWTRQVVSSGGGGGSTGGGDSSRGVGADIKPSGNITYVNTSSNIANVISNAANGTTIHFAKGTYYNVRKIGWDNKKLILDGEPGVIFDGGNTDQGLILYERADNSIIQDIEFRKYKRAIHVPGADNVRLRNLKFTNIGSDSGSKTDNTTYAIQIDNSNNTIVDRSYFKNCRQKCVGVGYGKDVDVKNSEFYDVNTGNYFNSDWNVGAIKYFAASGYITNVKTNNVKGNAIWVDTSRYVKVSKSESFNNTDAGVYIEKSPTVQVFDNSFNKLIMTKWSVDNGAVQWNNNKGNSQEPDYWNCGNYNCASDERDRAWATSSGRTGQF